MTEQKAATPAGVGSLWESWYAARLLNLLALVAVKGHQQSEQMDLLSHAGFRPREIARLLGTTPNAVRVHLSQRRRKKKGKKA